MNRRESLKHIALSSFGFAVLPAEHAAGEASPTLLELDKGKDKVPNGRLPEEAARDAKLMKEKFFTPQELATITVLCDIILPADATSGSASQAGVPAFIEFMAKDRPTELQTPLRGGLAWLDNQCVKRFEKKFTACSKTQQIEMVDDIAYPEKAQPAMRQGVAFFNLMRDLTMTGFYTTEMGFKDLGYVGNRPNNWEGVPEEVLKQYNLSYE
jgi:gluconate 2-dehydrogenase gamma chain